MSLPGGLNLIVLYVAIAELGELRGIGLIELVIDVFAVKDRPDLDEQSRLDDVVLNSGSH